MREAFKAMQGQSGALAIEAALRESIAELMELYRPSRHSFFSLLAEYPTAKLHARGLLDELYLRYQAAMHATRVMVYFLPHLDDVESRTLKLQILTDEDGVSDGDSHQYQLRRTWAVMLGRAPLAKDEIFGELSDLRKELDPRTTEFVSLVEEIYPLSLGPWVIVEGLAHDWIGALLQSLTPHFPGIGATDYFRENYTSCLEEKHAQHSLDTTLRVITRRPELLEETIDGARKMGQGLNNLWTNLESLLTGVS
jgi:hypothetical protein